MIGPQYSSPAGLPDRGRVWSGVVSWAALCLFAATLFCGRLPLFAAASMQTILTNGPTSKRLNIVILSEGYTASQLAQFLVDATNAVGALLSHPPYREYSNYFNAFAIKVASTQSGSDHPAYGITRSTYFSSTYDPVSDYLITIPAGSTGQGRVDALLQSFMPQCHLSILLVNDPVEGGSDGSDKTAIASTGAVVAEMPPLPPGIMSHETGHLLADLGDEYTTPYPGYPDTEEPNTTRQTDRSLIKWHAWVSTNTPVPTPLSYEYSSVVGLFEGAHYHTTGWYRPQLNCAMGSSGIPFCAVCSEALVLAFHQRVRPVDAFSPASTNLTVTNTQPLTFSLTLLQPATQDLRVQWHTNGAPCNGETNSTFILLPQSLPSGSNWIHALVTDPSPLVRNDPTNLLSQRLAWALNVSNPQLRLDSPVWLADGRFAFGIRGVAPQGSGVQTSTDLLTWVSVSTNFMVGGQCWYTNAGAGSVPWGFFRAVTPP